LRFTGVRYLKHRAFAHNRLERDMNITTDYFKCAIEQASLTKVFIKFLTALPALLFLAWSLNWNAILGSNLVAKVAQEYPATPYHGVVKRDTPRPDIAMHRPSVYASVPFDEDGIARTYFNERSQSWLSEDQVRILDMAYVIGEIDGHGELFQAVIMQETHAGGLSLVGHKSQPVGLRSYGVAQVKVVAAKDVLKRYPELGKFSSEEEIIAKLLTDVDFNLTVASKFLLMLKEKTKSEAQAVVAYNLGLKGSRRIKNHENYRYAKHVYANLAEVVRPFNKASFSDSSPERVASLQ